MDTTKANTICKEIKEDLLEVQKTAEDVVDEIVAMRLYKDPINIVYAEIIFKNGNYIIVEWSDERNRKLYGTGITANTLIYDERIFIPFNLHKKQP